MFLHSIKSYQHAQAQKLTPGVITSPRRNNYPREWPCNNKSVQKIFSKSLTVPKTGSQHPTPS